MQGTMNAQFNSCQIMTRLPLKKYLILAADAVTGNQIAALLEESDWCVYLVHSDKQAYQRVLHDHMDLVIADIDAVDLGGLAVLIYCHHHEPAVATVAITPVNDDYRKKLARELGGCSGFFYLQYDSLNINLCAGVKTLLRIPVKSAPDSSRTRHPIPVKSTPPLGACC